MIFFHQICFRQQSIIIIGHLGESEDPQIALIEWSFGNDCRIRELHFQRILDFRENVCLRKRQNPTEPDVWLQHVKRTRGTLAEPVSPALTHYAIQFSDYFQGFSSSPSFQFMISFAVRALLPWKYEFLILPIHVVFELFLKETIYFFLQELCVWVGACLNAII